MFLLLKSILSGIIGKKPIPYILQFEPSLKCNCRCDFCFVWKRYRNNELQESEIDSVLTQAYDLGCRILMLDGGEPFIAKHFLFTLRRAKEIGYTISVITNGSLLADMIADVAPFIDALTVSIDFPDNRHDKARKHPRLLQKALRGIDVARNHIRDIKINCNVSEENKNLIGEMVSLAEERGCNIYFRLMTKESKDTDADVIRDRSELRKAITTIKDLKKKHPCILTSNRYLSLARDLKPFKCRICRFVINIDAFGRIYAHCPHVHGYVDLNIESIREKPLKEIWYSDKLRRFRQNTISCTPDYNCYAACRLDVSLISGLDVPYYFEQLFKRRSIAKFFSKIGSF